MKASSKVDVVFKLSDFGLMRAALLEKFPNHQFASCEAGQAGRIEMKHDEKGDIEIEFVYVQQRTPPHKTVEVALTNVWLNSNGLDNKDFLEVLNKFCYSAKPGGGCFATIEIMERDNTGIRIALTGERLIVQKHISEWADMEHDLKFE